MVDDVPAAQRQCEDPHIAGCEPGTTDYGAVRGPVWQGVTNHRARTSVREEAGIA